MLGSPESLFDANIYTTDGKKLAEMDDETREWFNQALAGAPEISDDISEFSEVTDADAADGTSSSNIKNIYNISLGSDDDTVVDDNGIMRMNSSTSPKNPPKNLDDEKKIEFINRRRAMKKTMSDVTPSDIAHGFSDSSSDADNDSEESDTDNEGQAKSTVAQTRWKLVRSTMTPLMRWIAQGRKTHKKTLLPKTSGDSEMRSYSSSMRDSGPGLVTFDEEVSTNNSESPQSAHRSSETSTARKLRRARPRCLEVALPSIRGMKDETVEPLQNFFEANHFDAWEFNVFELDEITKKHSLWFLGMILFEHYKIVDIFQINTTKLSSFLLKLEGNYVHDPESTNPYHNHVHAADVLQTTGERAKRASLDEDEHTRDGSREIATDIMATSTTKLTHSNYFACSFFSWVIKNAPRFARRSSFCYHRTGAEAPSGHSRLRNFHFSHGTRLPPPRRYQRLSDQHPGRNSNHLQ